MPLWCQISVDFLQKWLNISKIVNTGDKQKSKNIFVATFFRVQHFLGGRDEGDGVLTTFEKCPKERRISLQKASLTRKEKKYKTKTEN